jgi:hypothetical protein
MHAPVFLFLTFGNVPEYVILIILDTVSIANGNLLIINSSFHPLLPNIGEETVKYNEQVD